MAARNRTVEDLWNEPIEHLTFGYTSNAPVPPELRNQYVPLHLIRPVRSDYIPPEPTIDNWITKAWQQYETTAQPIMAVSAYRLLRARLSDHIIYKTYSGRYIWGCQPFKFLYKLFPKLTSKLVRQLRAGESDKNSMRTLVWNRRVF